ncbi:MAG: right-handed parallel beta-helix repeat-containing protein [Kiritimatiellae bacterium]|nr:right-handed parallel beta-helix repeat-containing protein [Kiritimatiellia bacterium]
MKRLVMAAAAVAATAAWAKEVKVSSFGYDPEDSTRFLQAALDSGAERVVVDRQKAPWISKPLFARSNTEIVFEDGAEILAKKGEFMGKYDSLLSCIAVSNVVVRGQGKGGVLRLRRDDYTKPPYQRAEWRHALQLLTSSGITVENMSMCESGGDGVYVGNTYGKNGGPCRSVTLRDCVMDKNLRQGISVISVDGLLMERCVMSNTGGALPMAGIDFEPNKSDEVVRNAVLRDCRTVSNKGSGYELAFMSFISNSAPISVTLENCTSDGDACSFRFNGENMRNSGYVSGLVTLRGCRFRNPRGSLFGLALVRPVTTKFVVEGCHGVRGGDDVEMTHDWMWRNFPLASSRAAELPDERVGRAASPRVVDEAPGEAVKLAPLKFRDTVRYCIYADRAKRVNLAGFQMKLGRYPVAKKPIVVRDAGGRQVATAPMPGERSEPITFEVPAAGFYDVVVDVGRRAFALTSTDVPVAADVTGDWRNGLASTAPAWVSVPEGSRRFAVYASGSGGGELVGVRLSDPSGKVVWEDAEVEGWKAHVSGDRPAAGLWKFEMYRPARGVFEDFKIDIAGVQGYFFLTPTKHW